MEPKQKRYEPFLKPLLESAGSRYCIKDWPDEYRWDVKNYRQAGLLPDAQETPETRNGRIVPKYPALIIANCSKGSSNTAHGKTNASLKILDFARQVRQSIRSEHEPPPRMLIWMNDAEKQIPMPHSVGARGKIACLLEATSRVEEVAGSATRSKITRRADVLDFESQRRVAALASKNNISLPEVRMTEGLDESLDPTKVSRDWHQELDELESGFKNHTLAQFVGIPAGAPVPKTRGGNPYQTKGQQDPRVYTPEWLRLLALRNVRKSQETIAGKAGDLLQHQEEVDKLNREAYSNDLCASDRNALLQKAGELERSFKVKVAKLRDSDRQKYMILDDDRRVFYMDPPLLLWDRRVLEPLIAKPEDFHPHSDITLLDFQARDDLFSPSSSSSPSITASASTSTPPSTPTRTQTSEQDMYFELIANALLGRKGPTLLTHLDSIGPGAYKALIDKAPSLRDPRKGGRPDLENLRARTMTPEMFFELAAAWEQWPFKPSFAEALYGTERDVFGLEREGGPASRPLI